jgi:hypothetical protein
MRRNSARIYNGAKKMQFNLNLTINGKTFPYIAFMSDTPSAATLFNQLQYSSTIDGERWKIQRDIDAMRDSNKVRIAPADRNQELPAINRKIYRLPTFAADKNGMRYIESSYDSSLTDAARTKIEADVKHDINAFIAQQFLCLKSNAREEYRQRVRGRSGNSTV